MYGAADYTGIYIVACLFGIVAYLAVMYALVRLAVAHTLEKRRRDTEKAMRTIRPLTGRDG